MLIPKLILSMMYLQMIKSLMYKNFERKKNESNHIEFKVQE